MIILTSREELFSFEVRQWPLMISRHFGGDWYLDLSGMRFFFYCFAVRLGREKGRNTSVYWVAYRSSTKSSTKTPLSCEDDSNYERLLIRFVSANLTRRMIGIEFLEIYDRRRRSEITKSETSILRIKMRLDFRCVNAKNRTKFYRNCRLH